MNGVLFQLHCYYGVCFVLKHTVLSQYKVGIAIAALREKCQIKAEADVFPALHFSAPHADIERSSGENWFQQTIKNQLPNVTFLTTFGLIARCT